MNYQDIAWTAPDLRIRTVVQVTDAATDITYEASQHVAQYGERVHAVTVYPEDTLLPQQQANWLSNVYADTHQQIELVVRLGRDSSYNDWTDMLGLELGDLVNVIVTPVAGGYANEWDGFVETIDLTLAGDLWEWRLGLSDASTQRMLLFDDSVLGRFDFGGLLGW